MSPHVCQQPEKHNTIEGFATHGGNLLLCTDVKCCLKSLQYSQINQRNASRVPQVRENILQDRGEIREFYFESGTLECEGTLQTVDILYLFGTENIFVILSIRMRLLSSGLMKVVGNSLYIHCE